MKMDKQFLNFFVLEEGIVFYIAETILYVENRLTDKYFEDKFETLKKAEKQQLRWAAATSMILIFFIYARECKNILKNLCSPRHEFPEHFPRSFSVGIFIYLCVKTLESNALPAHVLLFPSITNVIKKYPSYFRVWDSTLELDLEEVIVRKENLVKYLNEITLMWTFMSCIKKYC